MKLAHFEKSILQRQTESKQIINKYPNRVCVYILKADNKPLLQDLDKNKYIVPNDLSIGQMSYVIRKRINLNCADAMFLMTSNNNILPGAALIGAMNDKYQDIDGFLYIRYTTENVFG
jgi:GABA(A) receptor-associated protein